MAGKPLMVAKRFHLYASETLGCRLKHAPSATPKVDNYVI